MNTTEYLPLTSHDSLASRHDMYFYIKVVFSCLLFVSIASNNLLAFEASSAKTFPLPMREVEEVLSKWQQHEGFIVEKSTSAEKTILLGKKGGETWRFRLRPDSPLATKIRVEHLDNSIQLDPGRVWDILSGYIAPPPVANDKKTIMAEEAIPPRILNLLDAVVCVRADHNGKVDQFSGFFVDDNGLILTTAHGLREKQVVRVMLFDGSEAEATVLLRNVRADLAILRISMQSGNYIAIEKGRNLLGIGEIVFTMGCPLDLQGTIYSGTVNGPPRRMEGLPYWQVDMVVFQGSSGSPVFDARGNFIAMVKGKFRGTDTIGFLIPLQTIMEFLQGNYK